MSKSKRDNFTEKIRRQLQDSVGGLCSRPDCRVLTVGASEDGGVARVGQAAHITAAAPGGPRYDANLSTQQRKSFDNGIWLCDTHAKEIDADKCRYSESLIRDWKKEAEKYAQDNRGKPLAIGTHQPTPLSLPPIDPQTFLGRDEDLLAVHQKLFSDQNLLLLVNGEGGIGKTTLASRYYHQYKHQYTHVAWVFAEQSLATALLTLAVKLDINFPPNADEQKRLALLITHLAALTGPCLLIIDNANDIEALKRNYNDLLRCTNFHILLTTRVTEFAKAPVHAIEQLSEHDATELFKTHYESHDGSENGLLSQVFRQVGYNTLVIELLAKNLTNINRFRDKYTLSQLFAELSEKGLFSLSFNSEVDTGYHANASELRQERVDEIIVAMYQLGDLPPNQKQLLSIFAVLPAEHISFESLLDLNVLNDEDLLEQTLAMLNQKGWIEHDKAKQSFRISPVIQAVVREQNSEDLTAHCERLIDTLIDKLEYQG